MMSYHDFDLYEAVADMGQAMSRMSEVRIELWTPLVNHFVMMVPPQVVKDGFKTPMSLYYYETYRSFYDRGLLKYRKRKNLLNGHATST